MREKASSPYILWRVRKRRSPCCWAKPAGKADENGRYPKQSVFGIIQQRLEKMREHERQEHARDEHKDPSIH